MRWEDERRSENIEDRRGMSFGGPGIQLGGLGLVAVFVVSLFTGISPGTLLDMLQGVAPQQQTQQAPLHAPDARDRQADFVAAVLGSTEDTWARIFADHGARYQPPRLVLFTNATPSACGMGRAAMGPFYCPSDRKVYIDLGFFRELDRRFGAPGDFARAYVVAHEVGHHVQNLVGTSEKVERALAARGQRTGASSLQVRMELQADCYAGVWARNANDSRRLLEPGDVEEGIRAAQAIGDDTLQKQAQGYVVPESFTHGTSEQRVRWFRTGFDSGRMESCNTFSAAKL